MGNYRQYCGEIYGPGGSFLTSLYVKRSTGALCFHRKPIDSRSDAVAAKIFQYWFTNIENLLLHLMSYDACQIKSVTFSK